MARCCPLFETVSVRGPEINREVIERIATMVAYELSTQEIVRQIMSTPTCPSRWVAFMANAIRDGRYTITARSDEEAA
jgi:hypothetical protein